MIVKFKVYTERTDDQLQHKLDFWMLSLGLLLLMSPRQLEIVRAHRFHKDSIDYRG